MNHKSSAITKEPAEIKTTKVKKKKTQEEEIVAIESIIEDLRTQQENIAGSNSPWNDLIFDWINIKEEQVKLLSENRIYEWLYPINFCKFSALIIEILNWNIENILDDREKVLQEIARKMQVTQESFFKELENIKQTLIAQNRAKLCRNGRIIIINQIWEEKVEVAND